MIEIDGESDSPQDQPDFDAAKTSWVEERGYRVICFIELRVEENLAGLVEVGRMAYEEGAGEGHTPIGKDRRSPGQS